MASNRMKNQPIPFLSHNLSPLPQVSINIHSRPDGISALLFKPLLTPVRFVFILLVSTRSPCANRLRSTLKNYFYKYFVIPIQYYRSCICQGRPFNPYYTNFLTQHPFDLRCFNLFSLITLGCLTKAVSGSEIPEVRTEKTLMNSFGATPKTEGTLYTRK